MMKLEKCHLGPNNLKRVILQDYKDLKNHDKVYIPKGPFLKASPTKNSLKDALTLILYQEEDAKYPF